MPSRANSFGLDFDEKSLNTFLLVTLLVIVVYQFFFNQNVSTVSNFGFDFGATVRIVNASTYSVFVGNSRVTGQNKSIVAGNVIYVRSGTTSSSPLIATKTVAIISGSVTQGGVTVTPTVNIDTGGQISGNGLITFTT